MSEEEKKAIEWLERAEFFSARLYAPIIFNLIEKQQKEIEDLQKVINVEKVMCEDMIGDVEIVCMYKRNFLRKYGDDYISKDKIREKIKELEQIKCTALTERTVEMMEDKINILNLLLKEN